MGKFVDLTGKKFGLLFVSERCPEKGRGSYWKCVCDCGNTTRSSGAHLRSGASKSCGCTRAANLLKSNITHGLTRHPLNRVWRGILERCYSPNNISYVRYGGRGVTVCQEWRKNFKSFYDWAISNGWEKGMQIDKDLNGRGKLYSPKTCMVVTRLVNNRRRCKLYLYRGKKLKMPEIAEMESVPLLALHHRVRKGLSVEDAVRFYKNGIKILRKDCKNKKTILKHEKLIKDTQP